MNSLGENVHLEHFLGQLGWLQILGRFSASFVLPVAILGKSERSETILGQSGLPGALLGQSGLLVGGSLIPISMHFSCFCTWIGT